MSNKTYMFCIKCDKQQNCKYILDRLWYKVTCSVCNNVLGLKQEMCYNNEKKTTRK